MPGGRAGREGDHGQAGRDPDRGGHVGASRAAVAELAVLVVATGELFSGRSKRRANPAAGADPRDLVARRQPDRDRDIAAPGAGVAELAEAAPAPGEHPAARGQREAVLAAAGDRRDLDALGQMDEDGGDPAGRGAVAELAELIVPPGVELPLGRKGEAVVATVRYLLDPDAARQVHAGRDLAGGKEAVAELARAVVAPGVYLSRAGQRQAVVVAGADGDGPGALGQQHPDGRPPCHG